AAAQPVAAAQPAAAAAPTLAGTPAASPSARRVKASPLARRIASELGVALAGLSGSGPQGRVVRADVERSAAAAPVTASGNNHGDDTAGVATSDGDHASVATASVATAAADGGAAPPPTPPATTSPGPAGTAKGHTTRHDLTRVQQTIARRMAESRATVPDFELRCQVDMSGAVALREQLREVTERPPSHNDFLIRAAALALSEHPRVNGSYRDESFEEYSRVNVGIAVAAEHALVVPTIFDADRLSLSEISAVARALAAKVRDGTISPSELGGSTFSVSNLGMFGVDSFSAVINPPQAAILAAGAVRPRAVVDEQGAVVAAPALELTLACDHRILYGADGARFLARVRALLEKPLALLV
ncbi:MAG: dihydrolipoamide acetyltransferase family protein, partial [Solirubrobacteraceae bacterium]